MATALFRHRIVTLVPPPSRGGIMILAGDWNADAKPDIAFVEGGAGAPTIDVLTNTTVSATLTLRSPTPPHANTFSHLWRCELVVESHDA